MNLEEINDISKFSNLEYLNLSFNSITKVSNLKNSKLKSIDLSYNLIEEFDFSHLQNLHALNLSHNKINDIKKFDILKFNPLLSKINVRGNPFCFIKKAEKNILENMTKLIPDLKIYNNKVLSKEIQILKNNKKTINDDLIYENSDFVQNIKLAKNLSSHYN